MSTLPPDEPLSLEEVKANLRVTSLDEDDLIEGLIAAAREHVEQVTGLVLTAREVVQTAADFGRYGLDIRAWPIRSITSVGYVDTHGTAQTLTSVGYVASLVQRPVRLVPAFGTAWPSLAGLPAAVVITLQAGYATPVDVPAPIRQAMHLLVAHWYANRSAVIAGGQAAAVEVPMGVAALLASYRRWSV